MLNYQESINDYAKKRFVCVFGDEKVTSAMLYDPSTDVDFGGKGSKMFTLKYTDKEAIIACSFVTDDEMHRFAGELMVDSWVTFKYPSCACDTCNAEARQE